jgi:hypothetical protein
VPLAYLLIVTAAILAGLIARLAEPINGRSSWYAILRWALLTTVLFVAGLVGLSALL